MRPEDMVDISEQSSKEIVEAGWTGLECNADVDAVLEAINAQLEAYGLTVDQAWRGDDMAWIRVSSARIDRTPG